MKKIMVVDDDKETTSLLDSFLTMQGYEPISVNDSTTAIEVARRVRPNMFLLDLMMPVIDGFKLCRMLRETPGFFFTPIIIVTALDDKDSKVVAFGAGANDYITKPYLPKELAVKIKGYLDTDEQSS
jgi:DNA-binding response OmpR family regulator